MSRQHVSNGTLKYEPGVMYSQQSDEPQVTKYTQNSNTARLFSGAQNLSGATTQLPKTEIRKEIGRQAL